MINGNNKYGEDDTSGDDNDTWSGNDACGYDEVNAVVLMHAMMVAMILHLM